MRKKNQAYAHIISGLMLCSTFLSTLVPTINTLADTNQHAQPQTKPKQESINSGLASSVTSFKKTASLSSGVLSQSTSTVSPASQSVSHATSASNSVDTQYSSSARISITSGKVASARSNGSHQKTSKAVKTNQVTVNYQYDGKAVGEKTYNVKAGTDLNVNQLPGNLQRHYRAVSGTEVKAPATGSVDRTVQLRQVAKPATHHFASFEPARDITPLPTQQETTVRVKRGRIVNPMFTPNNAPHLQHASQFHSEVPMTAKDTPRDLKDVVPFGNFSASVLRYKPYMDKVCQHYHMTHYEILMLAIMQCETGGHGSDVMQSSESVGLSAGSLNAQQSIEQAVRYMSGIVHKAQQLDRAEQNDKSMPKKDYHYYANDNRLLAQTYNYGGNFMDYVAHSKQGYSLAVSQKYSRDVVAPRLGNSNGSTYTYDNPISRMYHQEFLYTNGGNYFYGDLVEQYAVGGFMRLVLNHLIKNAGHKYVFGGDNQQHLDSAGLTSDGLKTVGVNMPKYVDSQWHVTHRINGGLNNAQPGDLAFFKDRSGRLSHVGFVIDRHTMFTSRDKGMGFQNLDNANTKQHLAGVRRVPQANKLNAKANQLLNKEAREAEHGILPNMASTISLGALDNSSSNIDTPETSTSTASGAHYTPSALPQHLFKYIHRPSKVGMHYNSTEGWSDPGDQCVNFSNSFFRAIWGQHRDYVMGNGIDMATNWSHVMNGHISSTPHAGAIASTSDIGLTGGNPAGHTFVVEHVFRDGNILVAEENWPNESGSDNGTSNDWDYAVLPESIADNGTQYFMPNKSKYHLKWTR